MKHVLMIAFHYPPEASSSGVLRTLKYSTYLAEYDWQVTVLSIDKNAYTVVDEKLTQQIPDAVQVVRTPYLNSQQHFAIKGHYPSFLAIPDRWMGWQFWAVAQGKKIIPQKQIDLIYSTSPHATAHVIASKLQAWSQLPWVMDFRDPWYEESPELGTPWLVQCFAKYLEKKYIQQAKAVVSSTHDLQQLFIKRYPDLPQDKFISIMNGYDDADFQALPDMPWKKKSQLILLHAGSINTEFRDPRPLFKAVKQAIDRHRIGIEQIKVQFLGINQPAKVFQQAVEQLSLETVVEFLPRVAYQQSLEYLLQADVLLLLQFSDDTQSLVPAKLYEYLRAKRPVWALIYPGAISDVMTQTQGGWWVNPDDSDALAQQLQTIIQSWQQQTLSQYTANQQLKNFDRRVLSKKLATVFDHLTNQVP